jgi:hypothetical protein
MNPAIEILHASPHAGACTCDRLMDEHLMLVAPTADHATDGWVQMQVQFRLLSLPAPLACRLANEATPLDYGPMCAWKFQYAPTEGPIPVDLTRVELPGQPSYGAADFNTPVSWDHPFPGQLWTASSHPDADLYWDPHIGYVGQRSLRVTVRDQEKKFSAGTGPTTHTEAGTRYRLRAVIRTQGDVHAWVEANEVLFKSFDPVEMHSTATVGPDSEWTHVDVSYVARGDDAPFVEVMIAARGDGYAWFDALSFQPEEFEHVQQENAEIQEGMFVCQ